MLQLWKVTDSLLISNSRSACDKDLLTQERVKLCINVSRQQPFPGLEQVQSLRVPVFDDPSEDLYKYFDLCSDAIEKTVRRGGKCLVYCKNGRSRSAAVCTAYLMKHQNLSLQDAFEVMYLDSKAIFILLCDKKFIWEHVMNNILIPYSTSIKQTVGIKWNSISL